MKIYIAGPMTGRENFNREAFNKEADRLAPTVTPFLVLPASQMGWNSANTWTFVLLCSAVLTRF